MGPYQLIATTAAGLEAVVVRELKALGYEAKTRSTGRVAFLGDDDAIARANIQLRSAERLLLEVGNFEANDFDQLYEHALDIDWAHWLCRDAAFPVNGRSVKSQLSSVPACQRTVKKAIVEKLRVGLGDVTLPEDGPRTMVEVSLLENRASITIDTTGTGLHKRGYRKLTAAAPLRETLAAALVELSFWNAGRPLLDPFCGSGTIAIEAAMMGRRIAPGMHRSFDAEDWPCIDSRRWSDARTEANDHVKPALKERIIATDVDPEVLSLARYHAQAVGVAHDIHFQQADFVDLQCSREFGCMITNPPYGERVGDQESVQSLYRQIPLVLRKLPTWSHYILTSYGDFEALIGRKADRRRKLFNGQLECTYYQFHGPQPPRAGSNPPQQRAAEPLGDTAVEVTTRPVFGGLSPKSQEQAEVFANRLRKTARHLRRWPTRRGITCYRMYDRDIPDVPLVVDRYEDHLHVAEYERPHDRTVAEHADWLDLMVKTAAKTLDVPHKNIFLKRRDRQRGVSQYDKAASDRHCLIVQEGGLKFEVNLSDYVDTGLFLDHRTTRGMLAERAAGKDVLNLFCYSGAFTVYAAAAGARSSTSVDLSNTYLDWARRNLAHNGLDSPEHQFVRSDVPRFIAQSLEEPTWDLAIVDPPTFSNTKSQEHVWDVQRDHAELIEHVARRLRPGGQMYFSTNSRRFKLDEQSLAGLNVHEITRQTIPEDFRNKRIHRCWSMTKPVDEGSVSHTISSHNSGGMTN